MSYDLRTALQDSTTLFEVLPVHVMDEAMQLACNIVRELLRKHHGYESLTEVLAAVMQSDKYPCNH